MLVTNEGGYDRAAIMCREHAIRRRNSIRWGMCLAESWRLVREEKARRLVELDFRQRYWGAAMRLLISAALLVVSTPVVGQIAPDRPLRSGTVTATPFENARVTVYRDSRGRSIGTATIFSNGITVYRGRGPWN